MSLLTKDELLKVATTSKEANMEPDKELSESDLFSEHRENKDSNKRTEPEKETSAMGERTKDNNGSRYTGKWKRDKPVSLEQQVEKSEQAIKSLKRHLEQKTCLKSLQYQARAHIRADSDFQKDIKRLRSNAERD